MSVRSQNVTPESLPRSFRLSDQATVTECAAHRARSFADRLE
jgi:hypothetical protein